MISVILLSLLFGLLPLGVTAGIIGTVIAARQEHEDAEPLEPGIGTVRRLFLYVLALVGLVFAATGVSLLISGALQVAFERLIVSQQSEALSTALSFTLVGTPAWVVFAFLAQRSVMQHPVETRSQARRLYFVLARGIAVVFVAFNAITVGRQVTGLDPLSSHGWGWMVAWGGVWAVHQALVREEPAPTVVTRLLERLYGYFAAVLGLVLMLAGIEEIVRTPLTSAYDHLTGVSIVDSVLSRGLRDGAIVLAVGGALWGAHWTFGLLRRDQGTTLWHVQIFVCGTLPGVALTVVPTATLLYTLLKWFVGVPDVTSASVHFAQVPPMVSMLVAGLATWGYHRAVLLDATRAEEAQSEPERVYRYIVALAGLLTAAIGLATILALACDALGGDDATLARASGWWRNTLIRALTLLAIGAPLWARYWSRLQRLALTTGGVARSSLSRRAFLFAAVGVALVALLTSLVVLLFQVLRPILDGSVSRTMLSDARWSIATAATSAVVAVYYLLVLREDQEVARVEPEAVRAPLRQVVLLAPIGADEVARALREIEGVRLRTWQRGDATGAAGVALTLAQLEALREAVRTTTEERLLVTVAGGTFEVVPYREA